VWHDGRLAREDQARITDLIAVGLAYLRIKDTMSHHFLADPP